MSTPDLSTIKASFSITAVVGETLKLRRAGRLFTACCPFHGEKTPSFYVYADHFHCFGCGAHGDVIGWLMQARGMSFAEAVRHLGGDPQPSGAPVQQRVRERPSDDDVARNSEFARAVWREAAPAAGSPAETYLRSRGLRLAAAPVLRFHPACPRGHAERIPAMLALMTDPLTAEPCGVHRTFLRPDGSGKADVTPVKMMLGRAGVIRLDRNDEVTFGLGIAEGIETALGVMQRIGWRPVWAAASAGGIRRLPPLPGIEGLTVFADADDGGVGLEAARVCIETWREAGRTARVAAPPFGTDWLDAAARLAE